MLLMYIHLPKHIGQWRYQTTRSLQAWRPFWIGWSNESLYNSYDQHVFLNTSNGYDQQALRTRICLLQTSQPSAPFNRQPKKVTSLKTSCASISKKRMKISFKESSNESHYVTLVSGWHYPVRVKEVGTDSQALFGETRFWTAEIMKYTIEERDEPWFGGEERRRSQMGLFSCLIKLLNPSSSNPTRCPTSWADFPWKKVLLKLGYNKGGDRRMRGACYMVGEDKYCA